MFDSPGALTVMISAAAAVGVVVLAAVGTFFLGPNARRSRDFSRARLLLRQGQWSEALTIAQNLRKGTLTAQWQGKLNNLEGECRHTAAEAALKDGRFEDGLEEIREAGRLLILKEQDLHQRVQEAMLGEVRRRFAEKAGNGDQAALDLARRAVQLVPCAEASFWEGLCHLRAGDEEQAVTALVNSQQAGQNRFLDPVLYLGAIRLRQGKPQEALRFLSDANRTDATCPVVPWQLGLAIVAAGGDGRMALQALARALGPRGLHTWVAPSANGSGASAQRLWAEGMPENRSFVRRLAQQHRYQCPLLGDDLKAMIRQGQMAMAQAHQRLGNFQAASDIYAQILQDNPPTFGLMRGLGLALARMERYDQAFKHLRIALEMEPKDAVTAGYLALCGAMGKPTQDDDKPKNIAWAVRLLARFRVKNDTEWARIAATVLREARLAGVAVTAEELATLCEAMASVHAADADAAAAYHQLAEAAPDAVPPHFAWLYCRAAQQHGVNGDRDADLFALAWRDQDALGEYYTRRDWDLAAMEYCYLERASAREPGRFPEALGPDYPPRGKAFLQDRSRKLEEAGHLQEALAAGSVLARLTPDDAAGFDRLAQLSYRLGDLHQAAQHLEDCCRLRPEDFIAKARLAVVQQQRGQVDERRRLIKDALRIAPTDAVARVAVLGAKLALASALTGLAEDRHEAVALLETSLNAEPGHVEAAWLLAATRCWQKDRPALAVMASRMDRPEVVDPNYQHLAAVCHVAAENWDKARAVVATSSSPDTQYLAGLAALLQGEPKVAAEHLLAASRADDSSSERARACLGAAHFHQGRYADSVKWWSALSAENRAAWHLDEPLKATAFLAAVTAFYDRQCCDAAEKFREAGRLGCRDRRLGPLLARSLFEAGREKLLAAPPPPTPSSESIDLTAPAADDLPLALPIDAEADAAVRLIEEATKAGCHDPDAYFLLGQAHKRAERLTDARAAFRKAPKPESRTFLQLGLLSLLEGQLAQAEQEFLRARELCPTSYPAAFNLLRARLSLDQMDAAEQLIEPAMELASTDDDKHFLRLLGALLRTCLSSLGDRAFDPLLLEMSSADEARLLRLIRGPGQIETSLALLKTLTAARRGSKDVQEAFFEAVLVQAKSLIDRGVPGEAERLLGPWAGRRTLPREYLRSLRNLLGCCSVLSQDFSSGLRHFQAAVALVDPPGDPRINQNIALTLELQGDPGAAEEHWSRCFDLFEYWINEPGQDRTGLLKRLLFAGLMRLVNRCCDREKWQAALPFGERAHRIKPDNVELLERLFQLYQHLNRPEAARWVLTQLRSLKPDDPQYELYEIDLLPLGGLKEAETALNEIETVLRRHAGNARVEERAQGMAVGMVSLLTRRCDHLNEELDRVLRRIRRQPKHNVDWNWVEDTAADLVRDFQRLKVVAVRCHSLVKHPDTRRALNDLLSRVNRKVEICESLEG